MRCETIDKKISLYLDERMDKISQDAFQAHLSECEQCKKHFDAVKSVKSSLKDLAPITESEGFDFEFNRKLNERTGENPPVKSRVPVSDILLKLRESLLHPMPATLKIAASILLFVSLSWGVHLQYIAKFPVVEFSAGDVKIYRSGSDTWIRPDDNMRIRSGDKIEVKSGGLINIASNKKYKARIKDDSLIIVSKLKSGIRNIDTDFSISYGSILVNTTDKFKGSKMKFYTPACDMEVVGTAFKIDVIENKTWLGVLEGRVKLISKTHPLKEADLKRVTAFISAGQKSEIDQYRHPSAPELLTEKEWKAMLELYQLTQSSQIMLLIGTGPDRVDTLLQGPAHLYIPGSMQNILPGELQKARSDVIEALELGNKRLLMEKTRVLEMLLKEYKNSEYDVEMLMFVASNYYYVHNYAAALRVFGNILEKHPDSEFASLAQCGIATIYQKDLNNIDKAQLIYKELLVAYPDSVDAIRAKESLQVAR